MTGPTEVPRWLQGAWRREGLSRKDGPMLERSDVLWLQTATYFADVRIPNLPVVGELDGLDEGQAFSGVSSFVGPRFTWAHDIDTRQQHLLSSDTALLERQSTFLLERGEDYVERWRREAEPDRVAVLEGRGEACGPQKARRRWRASWWWGGLRSGSGANPRWPRPHWSGRRRGGPPPPRSGGSVRSRDSSR